MKRQIHADQTYVCDSGTCSKEQGVLASQPDPPHIHIHMHRGLEKQIYHG